MSIDLLVLKVLYVYGKIIWVKRLLKYRFLFIMVLFMIIVVDYIEIFIGICILIIWYFFYVKLYVYGIIKYVFFLKRSCYKNI